MKNKAFTLIELLVVIAIIGLLSSIVLASLSSTRMKARESKRLSEAKQVINAIEMYNIEHGYYPELNSINSAYKAGDCNVFSQGTGLSNLISEGFLSANVIDPLDTATTTPKYCYSYLGLGDYDDYGWTSGWSCGGVIRTEYKYTFFYHQRQLILI